MKQILTTMLANARARQGGIVFLLGGMLVLTGFTSVNQRALFLTGGRNAAAFSALPESIPIPGTLVLERGAPRRASLISAPRFARIANPPTDLLPPAGGGVTGGGIPQGGAAGPSNATSSGLTPAAVNSPGNFGLGSPFNPAAPGGFSPDATPGAAPGGIVPADPAPVAPLPEPATWLMMLTGFFVVGALVRRDRRPVPARG